jgi:hypothetical protein
MKLSYLSIPVIYSSRIIFLGLGLWLLSRHHLYKLTVKRKQNPWSNPKRKHLPCSAVTRRWVKVVIEDKEDLRVTAILNIFLFSVLYPVKFSHQKTVFTRLCPSLSLYSSLSL